MYVTPLLLQQRHPFPSPAPLPPVLCAVMCLMIGISTAILQTSLFGFSSQLPPLFNQAIMAGHNCCEANEALREFQGLDLDRLVVLIKDAKKEVQKTKPKRHTHQ